MRARKILLAVALLAALVASCAKKPVALPEPAGAARFADFVFPAAAADLAAADVLNQHRATWQVLQSGDVKAAERDFSAILKLTPTFYPAEAGLGYAALARKDAQAALAHFDKAVARSPAYAPALVGKGEALLSLGRTDHAAEAFQAALAADPSLTGLSGASTSSGSAACSRTSRARAGPPMPGSWTRRGEGIWRRSQPPPKAPSSIASSPPSNISLAIASRHSCTRARRPSWIPPTRAR